MAEFLPLIFTSLGLWRIDLVMNRGGMVLHIPDGGGFFETNQQMNEIEDVSGKRKHDPTLSFSTDCNDVGPSIWFCRMFNRVLGAVVQSVWFVPCCTGKNANRLPFWLKGTPLSHMLRPLFAKPGEVVLTVWPVTSSCSEVERTPPQWLTCARSGLKEREYSKLAKPDWVVGKR
eukprot:3458079-Amphidinium_carterae.1